MSIYKACGIRGIAGEELTADLFRALGRALGGRLAAGDKFIIGGDRRPSTSELLAALGQGLSQAGVDVVDVGQLPTPMIHYARGRLRAAGCAVVAACDASAEQTALRWRLGGCPPTPEEVLALGKEAQSRPRARGRKATQGADAPRLLAPVRTLDVTFDYVATLQETWMESMQASLHVVVDPGYGSWSGKARRYLQAIFPHSLFIPVHDQSDAAPDCPPPDCCDAERLAELGNHVYRERAHLGLAFDADGDRVAVVDDAGMPLSPDETAWLLLEAQRGRIAERKFVHDLRLSDRVVEFARGLDAEPVAERSGPCFLVRRMREALACFGADVRGHYYFDTLDGGDDALFAACQIIALLAQRGAPLSQLRQACPAMYITPELRLPMTQRQQQAILTSVREAWSECEQSPTDGLRINTADGWALFRPCLCDDVLAMRFESFDWSRLDDLVDRFCESVPSLGEWLWPAYLAAMGTSRESH